MSSLHHFSKTFHDNFFGCFQYILFNNASITINRQVLPVRSESSTSLRPKLDVLHPDCDKFSVVLWVPFDHKYLILMTSKKGRETSVIYIFGLFFNYWKLPFYIQLYQKTKIKLKVLKQKKGFLSFYSCMFVFLFVCRRCTDSII